MDKNKKPFDDPDDIPTAAVTKSFQRLRGNIGDVTPASDPTELKHGGTSAPPQKSQPRNVVPMDKLQAEVVGTVDELRGGPSPYLELVAEQLTEERARKQSLEQRGFAVLSTSGFLVSLLFAVLGWMNSRGSMNLSDQSKIGLGVALASLIAAAVAGVTANLVRGYQELSLEALPILYDRLGDSITEAERRVFRFSANVLHDARSKNDRKAARVRLALTLQVLAATAVGLVIIDQIIGS